MFEVFNASATATSSSSALLSGKTYIITQSAQADGVSTINNDDAIKEARKNAQTLADQAVTDYTNLVINCNSNLCYIFYNMNNKPFFMIGPPPFCKIL